jgi:hypothetical protein
MFVYSRYLCGGTFTPNYICLIITYVLLLGGYNNAKMPFQNNFMRKKERNNVIGIEIINVVSINIINVVRIEIEIM